MNPDARTLVCAALRWFDYISHSSLSCQDKLRGYQKKLGTNSVKKIKITEGCNAGIVNSVVNIVKCVLILAH